MTTKSQLLKKLRVELIKVADPDKALQMKSYMKSQMPYHGVPAPILKKICKSVFADIYLPNAVTWQKHVLELWRQAKFREER